MIHHINKLKDKNHMIISVHAEKAFYEIKHPFMIKTHQRVGVEGTYLNIIKANKDPTQSKRYPHWWKTESISFKVGNKMSPLLPLLSLSFNIVLKVLALAVWEEKEIKGIQIGKEEVKLSLLQMIWSSAYKTLKVPLEKY